MALAFQFLGPPKLLLENEPINVNRRSIVALLAYLAVNDSGHAKRTYTREALSSLLWPDYDQVKAFTNLRHTLWEIQKYFGSGWLIADRETIGLHPDAKLWVDVHQFESLLTEGQTQTDVSLRIPLLRESVKLYRHHFMTGFNLKNAPTFEEWSLSKADELRQKLNDALTLLTEDYCLLGESESALQYGRRLVALDPLNESAHRQLMQAYSQIGQHNAALKQYQTFEQTLRKELGLDPQAETRALYKQIRKGDIRHFQVEAQKETKKLRNNLPHRLTTFIGRQQEQTEIRQLIAKNRLVTLVGAGGVGKSRLALQVGEKSLSNFPDGVWFIELAPLTDSALVQQTVCAALEIFQQAGAPALKRLISHLTVKRALLILDNCEHLTDTCAQLAETLLQACPDLHILATSRDALGINGERRYLVPSLSLPKSHAGLASIQGSEAVKLFVERAAIANPAFELSEANGPVIALICKKLDGMALAIELAAARVRVMKLEQIAERLDDAFQLLTGGSRTALPRHQTLRGTLDWSYSLLSEKEQTLLRRLSIFMGGWSLEIAEEVCVDSETLELLTQLLDKSLVFVNQEKGADSRYALHETVRQYAREKLTDSGEYPELRNNHRDVYLAFVERIEPEFIRAQQKKYLDAMETEIDNLRSAIRWSIEKGQAEQALRFCSAAINFWNRRGHAAEAVVFCRDALTCVEASDNIRTTPLHASVVAAVWWFRRIIEPLIPWSDESTLASLIKVREVFEAQNDYNSVGSVIAFLNLWEYFVKINDFDSAENCIHAFAERVKQAGYLWGIANSTWPMGRLLITKGDVISGLAWTQDALNLYVQIEDVWSAQQASNAMIYFKILRGELDEAMEFSKQLLLFYDDYGDLPGLASIYIWMGDISLVQGKYEIARQNYSSATNCMREIYDPWTEIAVAERKYQLCLLEGNLNEAEAGYRKLITDLREAPDEAYTGIVHVGLARVQIYQNHLQEANQNLLVGLDILQKTSPEHEVQHAYFGLGELARLENNYAEAIKNYRASLHCTNNFLNYISFPGIFDGIAKAECLHANFQRAAVLLGASEALRRKIGTVIYPVDRPDHDKHIELLKNQISIRNIERAWSKAANMSIEEAYEYALRD
jgi:predicted ATPase/DNA-binding SARP family transcriptional activator/tetratricopeptide (TPR) repeat protein